MSNNKRFSVKSALIIVSFCVLALFCIEMAGPKTAPILRAETYEVMTDDPMEYVRQCRFDIPEQADIVGVKIVYFNYHESAPLDTNLEERIFPVGMPSYYVKNIEIGESCAKDPLQLSSAKGPGTLTSFFDEAIPARWHSDTKIRAEKISKDLGISVTKTYQLSTVHTVHFPEEKMYEIAAFPIYTLYKFDVYYSPFIGTDYRAGSGQAEIPSGVCFVWYQM